MVNKILQKAYCKATKKYKKLKLNEKKRFEKIVKKIVLPVLIKKIKNGQEVVSVHSFDELFGSPEMPNYNHYIDEYLVENKLCLYLDKETKLCSVHWLRTFKGTNYDPINCVKLKERI